MSEGESVSKADVIELGRCIKCLKGKKSTVYCRLLKGHTEQKASSCSDCLKTGASTTQCRIVCGHTTVTTHLENSSFEDRIKQYPNCASHLSGLKIHSAEHCGVGYLDPYTEESWNSWLTTYRIQGGIDFKLCTGKNKNTDSNVGVLSRNGILHKYTVEWRHMYSCFRGGKPRYKKENKPPLCKDKPRNAPGSRLTECKAALYIRLLKTVSGLEILHVKFPLLSAHTTHSPHSLPDLQSHKPLPEIHAKVESLVTHSHLNQVNLMLALKDWVDHDLIPRHINDKQIASFPSTYDRRYYPTQEDIRNMSRKVVNKIRNNMFDQDALENFLQHEAEQQPGFNYFLRKYVTSDDSSVNDNDVSSTLNSTKGSVGILQDVSNSCSVVDKDTNLLHDVNRANSLLDDHDMAKQRISEAVHCIANMEKVESQENFVTGFGKDDFLSAKSTFLLVIQTKFQKELMLKYGNTISMMDAIYRTTKYGFPCFFLTVKTSLGLGRVIATIIPQNENEDMLSDGLKVLQQWNPDWKPNFFMMDKSNVELNAVGKVFPLCVRLLCDFHRAQAWQRWVNKSANGVAHDDKELVFTYLKNLAYAISEPEFYEIWETIQKQPWYTSNQKLQNYLESEWMSCAVLWAYAFRQVFHCRVDTNNITESFNNVLRKRYLSLRHDSTIFALIQVLVEVVFPDQELTYVQSTVKQLDTYRKPRYELPYFLEGKPHMIQSICLLNIERGKLIPDSHIAPQELLGNFKVTKSGFSDSQEESTWTVSIPNGTCTCPSFILSNVPCKHMFAVFNHYRMWTWDNLPVSLTQSPHILLDASGTNSIEELPSASPENAGCVPENVPYEPCEFTNPIPIAQTDSKQLYFLQKKLEEMLAQCRTLTFLTTDSSLLNTALQQCSKVVVTLTKAATTSHNPRIPPVFSAITEEFKQTSKTIQQRSRKRKIQVISNCSESSKKLRDDLKGVSSYTPGRPKSKRMRYKFKFPRQVSLDVKAKLVKAAAVLKREHTKAVNTATVQKKPVDKAVVNPKPTCLSRASKVKTANTSTRFSGCGACQGCQTKSDCGRCKMCLDKPKFGGRGKRKQKCELRKCILQQKRGKLITTVTKHSATSRSAADSKSCDDKAQVQNKSVNSEDFIFPSLMQTVKNGSGSEVLSSAFHISVTRMDMQTLLGLNWLNDQVINFYFKLVASVKPSVYATGSFFYLKLSVSGYEGVKQWMNQVDIFSQNLIIIPIHLGVHWASVVVDFKMKEIVYYDSKESGDIPTVRPPCLYNIRDYLTREANERHIHYPIQWNMRVAQSIPLQHNGSDCGVFTCMYVRYRVFGEEFDFEEEHMPIIRQKMMYEIYEKKILY